RLVKSDVGNVTSRLETPDRKTLDELEAARSRASGISDFSVGMAVASTSRPATRLNRNSNDPANDHDVVDSKLVADTLPPALAPRPSWADAVLERRRTNRVIATR